MMANKRPPFKIPDVINPPERRCIQMSVPDDPQHIQILWGLLRQLSDWQRWERDTLKRGTEVAQVWREVVYSIDWSNMSCCPDPTNQFYDENGILQVSMDGGLTYNPSENDPRFNSPLFPALPDAPGDELKCKSANHVVGYIKAMADQLIADGTAWNNVTTLIAAILGIIVLLLSAGAGFALTPLLMGLVAAMLGTGLAAFTAAMTEGVYSDLVCIVYCHTPNDGVYLEEDWQAIKADIQTQFTGIVEKFFYDTVNAFGLAGLNNAARTGVHAGQPCDDCDCSLDLVYVAASGDNSEVTAGTVTGLGGGQWEIESGVWNVIATGDHFAAAGVKDALDRCFKITAIDLIVNNYGQSFRALCAGGSGYGDVIDFEINAAVFDARPPANDETPFTIRVTATLV